MRKRVKDDFPSRSSVLSRLFEKWRAPLRTERVGTEDAIGRVLAADVFSLCDHPVFRASRMDGVALKSESFRDGVPDASAWTPGRDYARADTGDDFDDAFDAVVAVEDVEFLAGGGLRFHPETGPVTKGMNVAGKGEKIRLGMRLVERGTRLLAVDLAAIAMGAVSEIEVYRKPTVVFIATGSELVPLGHIPERGQTVNSNSLLAKHILGEMGAEVILHPIVRDDHNLLAAALDEALGRADVVVLGAGTSKGAEDWSHALLAERGELICHGVASAPGKPLAMALVDGKPVINVAGPPIACFYGMDWCARAVLNAFFDLPVPKRHTVKARLAEEIHSGPNFELFVRIRLEKTEDGYIAHPLSHFAGTPVDAIRSEGLYITKLAPEPTEKGDLIEVELMR
ncbi:MAG: molybdopterin molybdotransferase MoeA [Candidatus Accumulibacter sp.]|jgi:molybdopterin molybdotransferase/putative molybdopterin biosynthesis protein|nr:molybdopterin molybdotransferase MoeA [Accumulibacter sp.]